MEHLADIANRCGTDKGTVPQQGHAYAIIYNDLFRPLRDKPIRLLEIGLSIGGPEFGASKDREVTNIPSIRMWHEAFPRARIYGLDICDFHKFETDWFTFIQADSGDADALAKIRALGVEFDIIVDDGSHASYHQQLAFDILYPLLKAGGFYIVEDLNWQPPHYEQSLPARQKTKDFLAKRRAKLFDEDQLMRLRLTYNRERGLWPENPHYIDRFTLRGFVRRLLIGSHVKLGILQKPS